MEGDTNKATDIFVHDREEGDTFRVSVAGNGDQGNSSSFYPAISADGMSVAVESYSNNLDLVLDDTNNTYDIFVHDREEGDTFRVSVDSDGKQGNGNSLYPAISWDGMSVAFQSYSNNLDLVPDDTNDVSDVFVHDLGEGFAGVAGH